MAGLPTIPGLPPKPIHTNLPPTKKELASLAAAKKETAKSAKPAYAGKAAPWRRVVSHLLPPWRQKGASPPAASPPAISPPAVASAPAALNYDDTPRAASPGVPPSAKYAASDGHPASSRGDFYRPPKESSARYAARSPLGSQPDTQRSQPAPCAENPFSIRPDRGPVRGASKAQARLLRQAPSRPEPVPKARETKETKEADKPKKPKEPKDRAKKRKASPSPEDAPAPATKRQRTTTTTAAVSVSAPVPAAMSTTKPVKKRKASPSPEEQPAPTPKRQRTTTTNATTTTTVAPASANPAPVSAPTPEPSVSRAFPVPVGTTTTTNPATNVLAVPTNASGEDPEASAGPSVPQGPVKPCPADRSGTSAGEMATPPPSSSPLRVPASPVRIPAADAESVEPPVQVPVSSSVHVSAEVAAPASPVAVPASPVAESVEPSVPVSSPVRVPAVVDVAAEPPVRVPVPSPVHVPAEVAVSIEASVPVEASVPASPVAVSAEPSVPVSSSVRVPAAVAESVEPHVSVSSPAPVFTNIAVSVEPGVSVPVSVPSPIYPIDLSMSDDAAYLHVGVGSGVPARPFLVDAAVLEGFSTWWPSQEPDEPSYEVDLGDVVTTANTQGLEEDDVVEVLERILEMMHGGQQPPADGWQLEHIWLAGLMHGVLGLPQEVTELLRGKMGEYCGGIKVEGGDYELGKGELDKAIGASFAFGWEDHWKTLVIALAYCCAVREGGKVVLPAVGGGEEVAIAVGVCSRSAINRAIAMRGGIVHGLADVAMGYLRDCMADASMAACRSAECATSRIGAIYAVLQAAGLYPWPKAKGPAASAGGLSVYETVTVLKNCSKGVGDPSIEGRMTPDPLVAHVAGICSGCVGLGQPANYLAPLQGLYVELTQGIGEKLVQEMKFPGAF